MKFEQWTNVAKHILVLDYTAACLISAEIGHFSATAVFRLFQTSSKPSHKNSLKTKLIYFPVVIPAVLEATGK